MQCLICYIAYDGYENLLQTLVFLITVHAQEVVQPLPFDRYAVYMVNKCDLLTWL